MSLWQEIFDKVTFYSLNLIICITPVNLLNNLLKYVANCNVSCITSTWQKNILTHENSTIKYLDKDEKWSPKNTEICVIDLVTQNKFPAVDITTYKASKSLLFVLASQVETGVLSLCTNLISYKIGHNFINNEETLSMIFKNRIFSVKKNDKIIETIQFVPIKISESKSLDLSDPSEDLSENVTFFSKKLETLMILLKTHDRKILVFTNYRDILTEFLNKNNLTKRIIIADDNLTNYYDIEDYYILDFTLHDIWILDRIKHTINTKNIIWFIFKDLEFWNNKSSEVMDFSIDNSIKIFQGIKKTLTLRSKLTDDETLYDKFLDYRKEYANTTLVLKNNSIKLTEVF
jgi:hypothetical protein